MSDILTQKEKAKEKMLNAMLEYAGACHVENIANEMQEIEAFDEKVPFPVELDVRIRKLIVRHNRKLNLKMIWKAASKVFPKIAILFFVFVVSFTILITSVQAFRVKVLNFIIETGKEYTSFHVKDNTSNNPRSDLSQIPSEWKDVYIPSYIPEGFKIVKTEVYNETKVIRYLKAKEFIVLNQSTSENTEKRVDTEDAKTKKVKINNVEGVMIEKDGLITLVWHNNSVLFSLISKIDGNELIKIAESVEQKK